MSLAAKASKDPAPDAVAAIIEASKHKAARRLTHAGHSYVWPAEIATHAQMAAALGIEWTTPPGLGEILVNS